ncbi:MAG TPA: hypothetical protein VGM88_08480 [Kofleriaceae bacterium]|jgi:hypothetical protein
MKWLGLAIVLLAACGVGRVGPPGADDDDDGGGDDTVCVDQNASPAPAHMHAVGGTSNKGQACLTSGCHLDASAGAPVFQFGGTAISSTGAGAATGVTIMVSSNNVTKKVTTDADGNFYLEAATGFSSFTFPAQAYITVCPTITPMTTTLQMGGGNCNTCHTTASGAMAPPISI